MPIAVAVQIKHIDLIEALHQALAHPPKSWIIQVAVVADEGQYTVACLFDAPLCEADEFYIVVVEPFGVAFSKGPSINLKVVAPFLSSLAILTVQ